MSNDIVTFRRILDKETTPLPDDSIVRFLSGGFVFDVSLGKDGSLRIAEVTGRGLVVVPRVENVIQVEGRP